MSQIRAKTIEAFDPRPHLGIFCSGYDAAPLADAASRIGWHVTAFERLRSIGSRITSWHDTRRLCGSDEDAVAHLSRAPRAAAVVMTHDYERDCELVRMLLPSSVAFIGMSGPQKRTERVLGALVMRSVPLENAALARLHSLVGLDLGVETAPTNAHAVLAQLESGFAISPAHGMASLHDAAKCDTFAMQTA